MNEQPSDIEVEVARRLDAIQADPARLRPFDLDDDGRLDKAERDLLRTILRSEIARDWNHPVPEPVRLNERYRLIRQVGAGAQGALHIALDEQTQQFVAVKIASVAAAQDWKSLELFEREAQTLQHIEHANIPQYLDYFHEETNGTNQLVLVREYVHGHSLDELLRAGGPVPPRELQSLIEQLLETLIHLHSMSPPIVHRDIKPGNILRRTNGAWTLLDFGAVQAIIPDDVGGSTIVGTSGYMPPEQLMGRARPTSDLYALGATIVRIVTGRSPSDLPVERMRLSWRSFAQVDDVLAAFIDRLTEPAIEDRFASAERALADYRGSVLAPTTLTASTPSKPERALIAPDPSSAAFHTDALAPPPDNTVTRMTPAPAGSFISLRETDDEMEIRIPGRPGIGMILAIVGLLMALLAGVIAMSSGATVLYVGVPISLYLVYLGAESAFESAIMELDRQGFRLRRETLLRTNNKEGGLAELREAGVYLIRSGDHKEHQFAITLANEGRQVITTSCDLPEARWCAARINLFLERMRAS